jgi:hypothetical protein
MSALLSTQVSVSERLALGNLPGASATRVKISRKQGSPLRLASDLTSRSSLKNSSFIVPSLTKPQSRPLVTVYVMPKLFAFNTLKRAPL